MDEIQAPPPDEHMPPRALLALFDATRSQLVDLATQIMDALADGDINPLDVYRQLKCMELLINTLTNRDIKDNKYAALARSFHSLMQDEAAKNGKEFMMHGALYKTMEAGTRYDYSQCGDRVLTAAAATKAEVDAKVKTRQEWLRSLPLSGVDGEVDKETGEVPKIYPPSKTSTTTVSCSIK